METVNVILSQSGQTAQLHWRLWIEVVEISPTISEHQGHVMIMIESLSTIFVYYLLLFIIIYLLFIIIYLLFIIIYLLFIIIYLCFSKASQTLNRIYYQCSEIHHCTRTRVGGGSGREVEVGRWDGGRDGGGRDGGRGGSAGTEGGDEGNEGGGSQKPCRPTWWLRLISAQHL